MGKGFNNYMCKKFFHPASRDNLKRVWMAEQKADSYKKKQEELRQQYEKEQDLYTNKAILSKESKDKLSVNFMYEPPPGTKKEREREDDEPEYKFEWQRKFNAPREDYCKGDSEIRDQPFGIQVRNVRCIKCHKWGHINTDKECPMYCRSINTEQESTSYDPMTLVQQLREDGLAMKKSAFASQQHLRFPANQKLLESSEDEDEKANDQSEIEFLKSLTKEQKHKLLKKLNKLEKKGNNLDKKKDKKKKRTDESNSSGDGKRSISCAADDEVRKPKKAKRADRTSRSEESDEMVEDDRNRRHSERPVNSRSTRHEKSNEMTVDDRSCRYLSERPDKSRSTRHEKSDGIENEKSHGYTERPAKSRSTRYEESEEIEGDKSRRYTERPAKSRSTRYEESDEIEDGRSHRHSERPDKSRSTRHEKRHGYKHENQLKSTRH